MARRKKGSRTPITYTHAAMKAVGQFLYACAVNAQTWEYDSDAYHAACKKAGIPTHRNGLDKTAHTPTTTQLKQLKAWAKKANVDFDTGLPITATVEEQVDAIVEELKAAGEDDLADMVAQEQLTELAKAAKARLNFLTSPEQKRFAKAKADTIWVAIVAPDPEKVFEAMDLIRLESKRKQRHLGKADAELFRQAIAEAMGA